jgi:transcriptional regulator with XRE-family HTH domain
MKNLRKIRKLRKLSQVALAEKLKTGQSVISKWELEARTPHAATVKRIARALRCTVEALA